MCGAGNSRPPFAPERDICDSMLIRLRVELEVAPARHGNTTAMCLDKGRTKLATFVFNKKK